MTQALTAAEARGDDLQTANATLNADIRQLTQALTAAEARGDDLQTANENLAVDIQQLAQALAETRGRGDELRAQNDSLATERRELAQALAAAEARSAELAATNDSLSADFQKLTLSLEAAEALGLNLQSENARLATDLEQLARDLEDAGTLETGLQARNRDLASEVGTLRRSLDAAQVQETDLRDELERWRGTARDLRADVSRLRSSEQDLADQTRNLALDKDQLEQRLAELAAAAAAARTNLLQSEADLEQERALSAAAREQATLLNRQLADVRARLDELGRLLDAAEADREAKEIQIVELGNRLNAALATRVSELARYRSEFFGRLRGILGNRADVRIVGDRFIFQSEVLFASGSAEIGPSGRGEITEVSDALQALAADIPDDVPWILQIEGHTDTDPIATEQFPSNWELSVARATAVARIFLDTGLPPDRLAVAGFAEFQPIDPGDHPAALRRNRRIELKLTRP